MWSIHKKSHPQAKHLKQALSNIMSCLEVPSMNLRGQHGISAAAPTAPRRSIEVSRLVLLLLTLPRYLRAGFLTVSL